jgi:hypothetical protein
MWRKPILNHLTNFDIQSHYSLYLTNTYFGRPEIKIADFFDYPAIISERIFRIGPKKKLSMVTQKFSKPYMHKR